jgi:Protein of unknown function (DUF732)
MAAAVAASTLVFAAPADADPGCTEDCGVDPGQYLLSSEYMKGGLTPPFDIQHAITTSHEICDRAGNGATREQLRLLAGDGSDQQTDVVVNAAIKIYCPGVMVK